MLYTDLAKICARFYDLCIDPKKVAGFVDAKIAIFKPQKILFVGGFFAAAKELAKKYDLTAVDYTDEMVEEGKKRRIRISKADIRDLPFENEFDAVVVIGRVFTHMYSDEDAEKALHNILKALKPSGILLFDNYEDTKIQETNYFNGKVHVKDSSIAITRDSSTKLISNKPFIVNWKAVYTVTEGGKVRKFSDEMRHRAFSRKEIRGILEKNGFEQIDTGENFDDTSFYSVARKLITPSKEKNQNKSM